MTSEKLMRDAAILFAGAIVGVIERSVALAPVDACQ